MRILRRTSPVGRLIVLVGLLGLAVALYSGGTLTDRALALGTVLLAAVVTGSLPGSFRVPVRAESRTNAEREEAA